MSRMTRRAIRSLEDPSERARIARARFQQRDVRRRRHEVHAVLAELRRTRQAALGPGVLQVGVAGPRLAQAEHPVDRPLIVEPHDQHRQVLAQRAGIDRQVGRERRLPDAALLPHRDHGATGGPEGKPCRRTCTLRLHPSCERLLDPARSRTRFPGSRSLRRGCLIQWFWQGARARHRRPVSSPPTTRASPSLPGLGAESR